MAKTLDFSLQLKANNEDLKRKVNEALAALNQFNEQVRNGGGAFQTASLGAAKFGSSVGGLATQANQSAQSVRRISTEAADVPSRLTPIASGVQSIGRSLVGWAAGIASIAAVKQGIESVLTATMEMDKIKTRFEYAFGGAEEAGRQLEFVRETANRLGLEFTGTAQGYSQLASATKDLNITNEQTQQIFTGVSSAAATMGLSADETSGVILALSQIAGKGKVSMEELRGQLGERLTPAMSIAAKAMGVTTAELEKMVENGLSAEEFLPKFGAALEEAFGGKAASNAETLSGRINLLKNQFNELLVELGNSGLADAAADVIAKLGEAIQWVREQMATVDATELKESFADMADTLQTAFDALTGTLTDVFRMLNDVGNAFGLFGDVPAELSTTEIALARLAQMINFVSGAVNGVIAAFSAVGGAVSLAFAGALTVIGGVASALNKVGLVSDQTVKDIAAASEGAVATAAGMFERAEKSFLAGGESMRKAMEEVKVKTKDTAATAEKEMGKVGAATDDASKKAAALAAETTKTKAVLAKFGVDVETALGKPTKAMQGMIDEFPTLQKALSDMGITGEAAGNAVEQAFATMVKKAETTADIEAIRAKLKEMGDSGVLSVQQVADVTDDLDKKLKKVAGATDETTAAFERLGIKSKQALAESAAKMIADFETVKASGQATAEELDKAFKKASQAAAASGDSQAKIWMQSEAWMRGYTVAVDKNGETVVKKSEEAKQATDKLKDSYNKAGDSGVRASQSRSAALDEEIAKTKELANATASLKSDFASAKSGEITRTTGMSSYRTTYEYFKGKGFSDAEVAQLMTRTKEINDQAWNKLTTYQKSISTYGSGYGMTGANKALEEAYQRRARVSAYTPPAVSSPTTSTGAGRTVDLNLNLGGTTVNATTTTGQMASLENLLKQLEQSKRISGY